MPCDCRKMTYSHPLLKGAFMGIGIFATDMLLRPQFSASGVMELVLFGIEGVVCNLIYGAVEENLTGGSINLHKSAAAGITIWLTDFFLRPNFVGGIGMEMAKFLLQGIIVMMVFNYVPS